MHVARVEESGLACSVSHSIHGYGFGLTSPRVSKLECWEQQFVLEGLEGRSCGRADLLGCSLVAQGWHGLMLTEKLVAFDVWILRTCSNTNHVTVLYSTVCTLERGGTSLQCCAALRTLCIRFGTLNLVALPHPLGIDHEGANIERKLVLGQTIGRIAISDQVKSYVALVWMESAS